MEAKGVGKVVFRRKLCSLDFFLIVSQLFCRVDLENVADGVVLVAVLKGDGKGIFWVSFFCCLDGMCMTDFG